MYLCVLFASPLYFLARKKWSGFVLNSVLYGLGLLCIVSMVGIVAAPFFWILAVGHAGWHLRKEAAAEHADLIATKMAEKMQNRS